MGTIDSTRPRRPAGDLPFVSLVIPVRNRPHEVAACLSALESLAYPEDRLEVVVVDDASTDETPAAVGAARLGPRLRLLRRSVAGGPAAARNVGAHDARGDVVAFLDSDCLPEPDWLAELVRELDDPGVSAAGGAVLQIDHGGWLHRYDALRSPAYLGPHRATVRPGGPVSYLSGASLLVRRDALLAAGGFDESLRVGEDLDLVWRLTAAGRRVVYNPAAQVWLDHRDSFSAFLRRRMAYAGAEPGLLRRHPQTRRVYVVPLAAIVSASTVVAAVYVGRLELAPVGLVPVLAQAVLSSLREPEGRGIVGELRAQAEELASFLYHASRSIARYYAVPLVAAGLVAEPLVTSSWWLWSLLAVAVLAPSAAEWGRLRPQLGPAVFIAAGVLDNLAYHVGVLAACVRERTLAPLAARVSVRVRGLRGARRAGSVPPQPVRSE